MRSTGLAPAALMIAPLNVLIFISFCMLPTVRRLAEGPFPPSTKGKIGTLTPEIEAMNALVGMPLFGEENLWDDGDEEVANRLCLHLQGRTSVSAAFLTFARISGEIRPWSLSTREAAAREIPASAATAERLTWDLLAG